MERWQQKGRGKIGRELEQVFVFNLIKLIKDHKSLIKNNFTME